MSAPPPRASIVRQEPGTTSTIGASLGLSYEALADALNEAIPAETHANGQQRVCTDADDLVDHAIQKHIGGGVGRFLGRAFDDVARRGPAKRLRHVCQMVDYQVHLERVSPVRVAPHRDAVHVSTGLRVTGQVGLTGDLARTLGLDHKAFRGGLDAMAYATLAFDARWCPHLQAAPGFRWTNKAQLEIAHNVWLNIDGPVGALLKGQLQAAVTKVQSRLTCGLVTSPVERAWHPYTLPIDLPDGRARHLTFTPVAAGASGVAYGPTDARLVVSANAVTQLLAGPVPEHEAPQALPPLARIAASSNVIRIAVPVEVEYADLVTLIRTSVEGHTFDMDLPAGHGRVTIDALGLYPSRDRLAMRLHFKSSGMLPMSGTIYLLARPVLDVERQVVTFQDLSYTTALDSAVWSALASVFEGPIKAWIEHRAILDLKPKIASLHARIETQLDALAARRHIAISLAQRFAGLRSLQLADNSLDVTVEFDGTADLALTMLTIPTIQSR